MLSNIRHSPHVLRAITNGGCQDSSMIGEFPNLGDVWYNRASIAIILSLSDVRKVCRVTMDTSAEAAMFVHRSDASLMKFVEHPSGLYVFKGSPTNSTSKPCNSYTLLSTVAKHKKMFSRREVEAADDARALYKKLGVLPRRSLCPSYSATSSETVSSRLLMPSVPSLFMGLTSPC